MTRGRSKLQATKTVNPLHFEDLEPHRFEDLIRQLAYGFRPWRALEATGRLGGDQGVDIRGIEIAATTGAADRESEEDADASPTERIWTIQCRRYKRLPRGDAVQAVKDAVPEGEPPPYGLIVAAPADARTDAVLAFHEEARRRGVDESHLWTKGTIEDLLFRPENDHLLFAYFGISLRVRARSQASAIRDRVALKRKLLRALDLERIPSGLIWGDVLIRDVEDRAYPFPPKGGFKTEPAPWHRGVVTFFGIVGILVGRWESFGWLKPDGSWDYEEASRAPIGNVARELDREVEPDPTYGWHAPGPWYEEYTRVVPEGERVKIRELYRLAYEDIVELDPLGDPWFDAPHLFCRFDKTRSPYTSDPRYLALGTRGAPEELDPKRRAKLFVPGLIAVPYGFPQDAPGAADTKSEERS